MSGYLGAAGVVLQRGGDEEDEHAALDRRLKGGGVVDVRLEEHQPLRRAGERPQQPRLLLIPCQANCAQEYAQRTSTGPSGLA